MQRKVLDRAYKDAERELTLPSFALVQGHSHSRITGEPLRKAYERRDEGFENINDSELDVLRTYFRSAYGRINTEHRLERLRGRPVYY